MKKEKCIPESKKNYQLSRLGDKPKPIKICTVCGKATPRDSDPRTTELCNEFNSFLDLETNKCKN